MSIVEDLQSDRLFIANRDRGVGIILEAEIARTTTTNQKFIKVRVAFGAVDQTTAVVSKVVYTSYVLKYGLGESEEDEAANVASMVGRQANLRFDHEMVPFRDTPIADVRITSIG